MNKDDALEKFFAEEARRKKKWMRTLRLSGRFLAVATTAAVLLYIFVTQVEKNPLTAGGSADKIVCAAEQLDHMSGAIGGQVIKSKISTIKGRVWVAVRLKALFTCGQIQRLQGQDGAYVWPLAKEGKPTIRPNQWLLLGESKVRSTHRICPSSEALQRARILLTKRISCKS